MLEKEICKLALEDRVVPVTRKRRSAELWTPVGHEGVHADTTRFRASQGHGSAAERANHVGDVISGKAARQVGGDNVLKRGGFATGVAGFGATPTRSRNCRLRWD